jgi:AcrR family transcriptional regulator
VLAAAHELFVEQGYGATTVDQIAARAGVSKPTVFTAVGGKQTVLSAVRDVALAGDDEQIAVSDRPAARPVPHLARRDAHPHPAPGIDLGETHPGETDLTLTRRQAAASTASMEEEPG